MAVLLDKCCCLTLRTGVIIIGVLHACAAGILMVMQLSMIFVHLSSSHGSSSLPATAVVAISVVQSIITVYFAVTVALICGARKGNRYLLIPFVSVHGLCCSYLALTQVLSCLFLVSSVVGSVICGVIIAVNVYVIYVVISHHQELKRKSVETMEEDEISIVNAV